MQTWAVCWLKQWYIPNCNKSLNKMYYWLPIKQGFAKAIEGELWFFSFCFGHFLP